jgi:hypothetical protein
MQAISIAHIAHYSQNQTIYTRQANKSKVTKIKNIQQYIKQKQSKRTHAKQSSQSRLERKMQTSKLLHMQASKKNT